MTPDQRRLAAEAESPRIVRLARALAATRSITAFMNSGAHPDDETSAMLAALGGREGMHLSYVCSTRGEGGQNDIGTEIGAALGTLRTAEMERAAAALDMRLYWLSPAPGVLHDFGFSKSGEETLARWGEARALEALVRVVRAERPDILCPTFLDVPGQHGHHRAMTRLARDAFEAAADPGHGDGLGEPWAVAKLCLPAWGGGGGAYDDTEPPPPETFRVDLAGAKAVDPITGASWERLGQRSRAWHRTQGMGHWIAAGEERIWPLHLAETRVGGAASLGDGLPTLADLDDPVGHLGRAGGALAEAREAFPDNAAVARALAPALAALRRGMVGHPERHRLARLERAASRALVIASGAEVRARAATPFFYPGARSALTVELREGSGGGTVRVEVPDGWSIADDHLVAGSEPSDPYPDHYDPHDPPAPRAVLEVEIDGVPARLAVPVEGGPCVLPPRTVTPVPGAAVVNRAVSRSGPIVARLEDVHPEAPVGLDVPEGWTLSMTGDRLSLDPAGEAAPDLYALPLTVGGEAASTVTRILHPHVEPRALHAPAILRVRVLDAALAGGRIGYVGAGRDRVGDDLRAMGADARDVADDELASRTALDAYDTIVIGIFAVRFRDGLREAMGRLHEWTRAGGNLVTLYHRPWDGWDPDAVPPLRLEIGQPSLRWRVTDEAAAVTHLAPDHPLLNAPNAIRPDDWAGWDKERGLYFARSWDPAYVPLVSMHDPDEAPLTGALLSAPVGEGRHTHTSLILHHQMRALVPGAFRLMANLVAPAR